MKWLVFMAGEVLDGCSHVAHATFVRTPQTFKSIFGEFFFVVKLATLIESENFMTVIFELLDNAIKMES